MIEAVSKIVKISGPGLLFASTAIGVSHLIQSTRAGADFGLMIIGFVVLVSVLKYPFFEYGSRYANSTQTSIIDGYKKLGTPILVLYLIITVCSMFFVTGAVGFVTAGFFENLLIFFKSFLSFELVFKFGIHISSEIAKSNAFSFQLFIHFK